MLAYEKKKSLVTILLTSIIVLCLIAGVAILLQQNPVIAEYKGEKIYQSDINYEMRYAPPMFASESEKKDYALDKIKEDSDTLQKAESLGLVELDKQVFNSSSKDYSKRIEVLQSVEDKVLAAEQGGTVSGELITVWFYNTVLGDLGYDKAKETAYQKANELYTEVKTGKNTMLQAAEKYKQEPLLQTLDPYAGPGNVYATFTDVTKETKITFDDDFNTVIHNTRNGELTPIVGLKEIPIAEKESRNEPIEVVYAFARITENAME